MLPSSLMPFGVVLSLPRWRGFALLCRPKCSGQLSAPDSRAKEKTFSKKSNIVRPSPEPLEVQRFPPILIFLARATRRGIPLKRCLHPTRTNRDKTAIRRNPIYPWQGMSVLSGTNRTGVPHDSSPPLCAPSLAAHTPRLIRCRYDPKQSINSRRCACS